MDRLTTTITGAPANPQPLFFGGDNTASDTEHWRGYLDDLRIYNNALSPDEVLLVLFTKWGV